MATSNRLPGRKLCPALVAVVTILSLTPPVIQAQELEEVVVTAQRRVQSLQDVPLSIEAVSGAEIQRQGFRNMEDLSFFSPSVYIQSGVQDQQVTVRGFGTIGNSLTLEQAVPIFLDGIHHGRQSQIKTAFLDVDRVEILKGPQPAYFGMNATAGAFNIQSKKPTPTWEGDLNGEYGNNGTQEVSFGLGGPITDTIGIRVAGIHSESDGFLENAVTGDKYPKYNHLGGRAIVQWTPLDNFQATAKIEASKLRNGSEAVLGCITDGNMIFGRKGPTDVPSAQGDERSVWTDPPKGAGWTVPHTPISTDCFDGNVGLSNEGPYFQPPDYIHEENSNFGSLDIRKAADAFATTPGEGVLGDGLKEGIKGHDFSDSMESTLDMKYTLGNGIEIDSLTGYIKYDREDIRDNCNCPFLMNYQGRTEKFRQTSSELRFTSPSGGMFEWMVGFQIQTTSKDNTSSSLRANVRRGQRYNKLWEDTTWQNVFATVTFNFLDDKASIDLGGRYSHIKKEVNIRGYGAAWIYDVEPVSAGVAGTDYFMVDPADARLYVDTADTTNLWTLGFKNTRTTPDEWLPSQAAAVGLTAADYSVREGPWHDKFTDNNFDPQVTLRWRPTPNHSLFARWAQASKAAGYDTGQTSIPDTLEEMKFNAEYAESWEVGSKGTLWNNRVRYNITLFRTTFTDLQLSGLAPVTDFDETSISLNAGEQRVQGIEFGVVGAVTDQLRLGVNGAIMDGKMTDFAGSGCNDEEFYNADLNLGVPGLEGCDPDSELIDRTGDQAPRTPDWKFVFTANYWFPVLDNYEVRFNAKGYVSSGYITARDSFTKVVKYNRHGDLNLDLGFGDSDGTWELSAYAHNIFEARESYNAQYDVVPDGIATTQLSRSSFLNYGVKFNYKYR